MERIRCRTQTYRHSNDNRRVNHSLGRLDTQTPSSRVLEQENVISTFKLPRTVCSVARIKLIETVHREQNHANTHQQYHYHSIHKQAGWFNSTIGRNSETCTSRSNRHECIASGLISFRSTELESRPVVAPKLDVQVETPSKLVRNVGSVLGPSSYRQICINDENSTLSL